MKMGPVNRGCARERGEGAGTEGKGGGKARQEEPGWVNGIWGCTCATDRGKSVREDGERDKGSMNGDFYIMDS